MVIYKMIKKNFLIEIGTEELPSKNLRYIAQSFEKNVTIELNKEKIIFDQIIWYATPRRIALKINNINFCKKMSFIIKNFDKKINIVITNALKKISVVKFMRWSNNKEQYFIRPIKNVLMLLENRIVASKILGVKSTRIVLGHRFIGQKKIKINNINEYEKKLLILGKVIVNYKYRKNKIKRNIEENAKKIGGLVYLNKKNSLIEEVNSLVEWPVVLIGQFEKKFLLLPQEALIYIMEKKQKYFPVFDINKKLMPYFIFVSNIETQNKNKIIKGNEKVIRSSFSDIKYFYMIDSKIKLEKFLPYLKNLLFHQKLGNMFEKTQRIIHLSRWLTKKIDLNILSDSTRAALLSKCDLMTNMVCEFPEIQGIMGMYYARLHGEKKNVYQALEQQYLPNYSKDNVPDNIIASILSIADKIDTIVGIFFIDISIVKGSRDPFGLRRMSLAIMRIIIENNISIDLSLLIKKSCLIYKDKFQYNKDIKNYIINFSLQRLAHWYKKNGFRSDIFKSVLAVKPFNPVDFNIRIKCLSSFFHRQESKILFFMYKRINNILFKVTNQFDKIEKNLLEEQEEKNLYLKINTLKLQQKIFLKNFLYEDALLNFLSINTSLDIFFKQVKINIKNKKMKLNRINMIYQIKKMMLKIADISFIEISSFV